MYIYTPLDRQFFSLPVKMVEYGDYTVIQNDKGECICFTDVEKVAPLRFEPQKPESTLYYCGNQNLPEGHFYLTFTNARGFLAIEDGKLVNGVPWTQRTVFTTEKLTHLLGPITLVKVSDHN